MRYDERIAAVLGYLRAAKHEVEIRLLLEKLTMIYPDSYASAYRMFRRDVRLFNAGIGAALGYSILVAHRPAQCSLCVEGIEQAIRRYLEDELGSLALSASGPARIEQAIRRYLEDEAQFIAAVRAGIADADAGRVISTEEMEARLDAIDAKYEANCHGRR